MFFSAGVTCHSLPPVGFNMQLDVTTSQFGGSLTYTCNEGYILNDMDVNRTCQQDGTWSQTGADSVCGGEW